MKAGKLSESILKRSVLRQLHNSAVRAPGVGIDFGAVDASAGKQIVTAEACRAFDTFPEAGVYAALNNLACSGAKPLGITMTLLLPTSASENDLRAWISAVSRVSEKEQIPVLGGHTEVLRTVTSPQLIVQAVGEADRELFVTAAGAQPDMDVIVTKWVGLGRCLFDRRNQTGGESTASGSHHCGQCRKCTGCGRNLCETMC